jgi:gas vesicle protein
MKDSGKIVLAALAGAAIGTAIALLFAPAKGEDTRKDIMDAADELANKFKDKVRESTDAINDLKERIFQEPADHYGNGNENLS